MRSVRRAVGLALLSGLMLVAEGRAADFLAGAALIDVTPSKFPVDSAGSMGPRQATSAHDPLHVRCLVLDDGETQLAIALCDFCMIPREIMDPARFAASEQTGIPAANMLIAATHTHTSVTVTPTFQSEVETAYGQFLTKKITEAICKAYDHRRPARLGYVVGTNPHQVFNRRWHMRSGFNLENPFGKPDRVRMNPPAANADLLKPAGVVDPEVAVLAVTDAESGRFLSVLANYSLHYVGGVPSRQLSADYFGEFARIMERRLETTPNFVGILSNGTSGDINNINFYAGALRREPFEQIRLVAEDVAASAENALQRLAFEESPTLAVAEQEITARVRKPSVEEIAEAESMLSEAGPGPYRDRRLIYASETMDLADYPESVSLRIQALRIGRLGIVSSPCETFVETGLAVKQQSPLIPTFTIELANGYNGYLPPPEQHRLGGYETWRAKSSYLHEQTEPLVRRTQLELLQQVAESP